MPGKQQNYKIYISESVLILCRDPKEFSEVVPDEKRIITHYSGKTKSLFQYIDLLEKTPDRHSIILYTEDLDKLWADFGSITRRLVAAGGVVTNPLGEIIAIYRRGNWDLPKGKQDPGESIRDTAIREVEEEVGVSNLQIERHLGSTYHLYREKKGRVLKETVWYLIFTRPQKLIPQKAEKIEKAIWVRPAAFVTEYNPLFRSIREFLRHWLDSGFYPN